MGTFALGYHTTVSITGDEDTRRGVRVIPRVCCSCNMLPLFVEEKLDRHTKRPVVDPYLATKIHSTAIPCSKSGVLRTNRAQVSDSASVFKRKQIIFWILWSRKDIFKMMKLNIFQGDQTTFRLKKKHWWVTGQNELKTSCAPVRGAPCRDVGCNFVFEIK